ncbi:MAG: rhomboid family intramembrane serine protease [Nitrospiraceae bacterium]|nr:rhomboid family intramembrane serine protease [Nitrospiraceae bacterium]
MIPYKDDNPTASTPYATISIIVINCLVFIYELLYPGGLQRFALNYGAIPYSIVFMRTAQPISPVVSIFTSMFIHGGFLHIGGNMLYLWIFGDNIEDRIGHLKFILFYLLSGVAAAYSFAFTDPASTMPMIGASGAIAGILGAYILLFPRAQVYTIMFLGIFVQIIRLPALIVIGFWALIQFLSGFLGSVAPTRGGIAWFAHVGGFLFGLLTVKLFMPRRKKGGVWL